MTMWLVKRFVKKYEEINDERVRMKYGTLSSVVGIIANICLFAIKIVLGTVSNSIAITSDAFNNLSDSASCIVTLFGYKMAAKPADKDHPFGHGRVEHITSLFIAVVILLVGVELFKTSVNKIMDPPVLQVSIPIVVILISTILVKLWMYGFNKKLGNKVNSTAMLATSKDSLNDVFATSAALIALVGTLFIDFPLDGIMGIVVSILILYSGYEIIRTTVDELIGQPADKELVDKIESIILKHEEILGLHDMIIHNYGPGKMIGSAHVEVGAKQDFLLVHDVVDEIEREIETSLHVMMTLHMDPVIQDDAVVNEYLVIVEKIIHEIHEDLSLHDFRVVEGPTHTNIIFDLVIPYDSPLNQGEVKAMIDEKIQKEKGNVYTVIKFDRGYC